LNLKNAKLEIKPIHPATTPKKGNDANEKKINEDKSRGKVRDHI